MLEIKILVSDVDYDSVADLLLPIIGEKLAEKGGLLARLSRKKETLGSIAHKLIAKKGQEGMELFVADICRKKRDLIIEKASELAARKGIGLKIIGIDVLKI